MPLLEHFTPYTLRFKFNAAILITFIVIAVLFITIQVPFQQQRLETMVNKVNSFLHALVEQEHDRLANALIDHRIQEIQLRVQRMLKVDGILRISVFDKTGKVLSSEGEGAENVALAMENVNRIRDGVYSWQDDLHGQRQLLYLHEIQVISMRCGFIQLSYSLADVEQERRQVIMIIGSILVSILLVLVLLNVILSTTLIQPIRDVRDAMRRIQAGELGTQAPVATRDELGDLASTFNIMSRQISYNYYEQIRLNQLVKEQEQARRQREIAEAANQAKSEFLKTISHDIRNPLNAIILGLSNLTRHIDTPDSRRRYLQRIDASSKILQNLVNGVLDLSSIEAGQFYPRLAPFRLREAVQTAVDPFLLELHEGVDLTVEIDAGIPDALYGEGMRVTQILANLVSNAVKFTNQGSIVVRVHPSSKHESSHIPVMPVKQGERLWLRFSVQDSGRGISEEEQRSIFEVYVQGRATQQHHADGTGGIGLAIVKRIVNAMGGEILLQSHPGCGTRVHIFLPFTVQDESPEANPDSQTPCCAALRVLVVEDNISNRFMLTEWLRNIGCRVMEVADGKSALDTWRQGGYDVILMDVQMPKMDGLDTTRQIRQCEQNSGAHVHIIALTAAATTEDRDICFNAGMDDYLSKPLDMKKLLHALSQVEPQKKSEGESELQTIKQADAFFYLEHVPVSWQADHARLQRYLDMLKADIRQSLTRIEQAMRANDDTVLSQATHRLKGAILGKVRSEHVVELVRCLDAAVRQKHLDEATELFTRLRKELEQL